MNTQDRLRKIIVDHCAWLEAKIEEIAASIGSQADRWSEHPDTIRHSYELTHQVSGACGTMGFADVGMAAAELEVHLKSLLNVDAAVDDDATWFHTERLFERLKNVADGISPEQSTLYNTDLTAIR